jgi:hypothetical protein
MKYSVSVWIEPNKPGFDIKTKTMFESDSFKGYPGLYIGNQLSTQKPVYEDINGVRYQVFTDTIRAADIVKAVKARANWLEKLKSDCQTLKAVYDDITVKLEYSNIEALDVKCKDKAIKGNQNIYDEEADKLTISDFKVKFKNTLIAGSYDKNHVVVNGKVWNVDEFVKYVSVRLFVF